MSDAPPATQETEAPTKPLIDFPCDFLIKAIGLDSRNFEDNIVAIFLRRGYSLENLKIFRRPSREGKYVSVSIEFHVLNRLDLDAVYRDLGKLPEVKMLL
jgi:putative lipoic acid-binding regulatory protein